MTYKEFIDDILNTRGRFSCGDSYHERHHIVPICLGGLNETSNLIDLYAKEHFVAHKLLAEEHQSNSKLVYGYAQMAFCRNSYQERYELTPEEYEDVRKRFSNSIRERYKNKENHPSYGKHLSEERKKFIGDLNRGNKYCVGRVISPETREKISKANKNPSEETRKKMSEAQKKCQRGENNSRAIKIIDLNTGKIYGCIKQAALELGMNYDRLKYLVRNSIDFIRYDIYENNYNTIE